MEKQNYFEELILRTYYNTKQYRGKKEQIQNEDTKKICKQFKKLCDLILPNGYFKGIQVSCKENKITFQRGQKKSVPITQKM